MKKSILIVLTVVIAGILNFSAAVNPDSQARTIITKMIKAIDTNKGSTYTMRSMERIKGMKELRGGDIFTKINVAPRKTYMNMVTDPNKGTEILYVEGERGNKALVNPGKYFPSVTLEPTSGLLTKDQHHMMLSAGFGLISKIVGDAIKKADAQGKFETVFKYEGDITWNNRACYKVVIEDPTWTYTTYTAGKGENMASISSKLLIPEYSLVELDGVKNFEEKLDGKTLKVPTSYAKKTIFYIDKENNFPIYQECSDDKGVFEHYEFYNLNVNPGFKADEFTKGFDGYKF